MQSLSKYDELGRPLTTSEVDGNWSTLEAAIAALENGGVSIVGINLVENESGASLQFLDGEGGTVALIPFPAGLQQAGAWVSGASYTTRDIVTSEGGTYLCSVAHTASGTDIGADLDLGRWLQLGSVGGASIAFQAGSSGLVSDTVQDAILEVNGKIEDALVASNVDYDNTASELASTNVQAAIDEIVVAIGELQDSSGGSGGTDDQTAAEVPFTPPSGMTSTNVQAAIVEVKGLIGSGGGTDDQTAAEVSFTPPSGMTATNVQTAIEEVKTLIGSGGGGSDDQTAAEVTINDSGWTMIGGDSVQDALSGTDTQLATLQDAISNFSVGAESVSYGGETVAAFLTGLDNRVSNLSSAEISHPYNGTVLGALDEIIARLEALESA